MIKTILMLILGVSLVVYSAEGTGEKIGKKVDKTIDDVSAFSTEQKEKIQKEFKDQLAALDQEIKDIKASAKKAKATATDESKKQINDQIDFLEKRKAELKSDFQSLQGSSGRAWDKIKTGFQESMGTLKESFRKAKQEFQSEEEKK